MATTIGRIVQRGLRAAGIRVLAILLSDDASDNGSAPTITAGSGAASASEVNGSVHLRTDGVPEARVGGAWKAFALAGQTFDAGAAGIKADVIAESTSAAGVTVDGLVIKDGGLGPLPDSAAIIFGTGSDISATWDGTKLAVTQAAPNSAMHLGVDGAGIDLNLFGDTPSATCTWDQSLDAWVQAGVASTLKTQGDASGVLLECVGEDKTHGLQTWSCIATLSPAAIETAVITLPANSKVVATSMNVTAALTGGGTTVTVSLGITGDVDKFGTLFSGGVQADLLTKDAKGDFVGTTTNAGAGIGVSNPATVAIKLIGAATGGASAGDTALTGGSVKVRIIYQVMASIADA